MKQIKLLIIIALVLPAASALAQKVQDTRYLEQLAEFNTMDPLQKPAWDGADNILSRRIFDDNNRVIGEVEDVLLVSNGSIDSVYADLDRLRLHEPVYLNYNAMRLRPATHGYVTAFEDDQIEKLYPQLLANIETAAGNEDIFSLKNLIGLPVVARDGRRIGKVGDVLFRGDGSWAEALYITMEYGTLRGRGIAVPFNTGTQTTARDGRPQLTVSNSRADMLIDFAKTK